MTNQLTIEAINTIAKIDKLTCVIFKHMHGTGLQGVTPFSVCQEIAANTVKPGYQILDPACGKGSFLLAAIRQLIVAGMPVKDAVNSVTGLDISASQIQHARTNIHRATGYTPRLECTNSLTWETNMKFDVVIGNPPFNDDQNIKNNSGNYVSGSKKLHLAFMDKALELAPVVVMIAPVRGWFVGKNKPAYLTKYTAKGMYRVENKAMPFSVVTGEIGVFYFDAARPFEVDEFTAECVPLSHSVLDDFEMYSMVGAWSTVPIKENSLPSGKYEIIITSKNKVYTDSNTLFDDPTRGNWRVAFNHNGNKTGASVYGGAMLTACPNTYLSKSMSCFITESEEQATQLRDQLMSPEMLDWMRKVKVSNTNSKYHFSFLPGPTY